MDRVVQRVLALKFAQMLFLLKGMKRADHNPVTAAFYKLTGLCIKADGAAAPTVQCQNAMRI